MAAGSAIGRSCAFRQRQYSGRSEEGQPRRLMSSFPRLYLVTNRRRIAGPGLLQALDQAFAAGVRLAMLRERGLEARDLLALAKQAVARATPCGARVLVNDRLDVALLAGAAGVHLRESSVPLAEARRLMWAGALIGASVHDEEGAAHAVGAGASLVLFGPVYETPDKARYRPPQGIAALRRAARAMRSAAARAGGGSRGGESLRVPLRDRRHHARARRRVPRRGCARRRRDGRHPPGRFDSRARPPVSARDPSSRRRAGRRLRVGVKRTRGGNDLRPAIRTMRRLGGSPRSCYYRYRDFTPPQLLASAALTQLMSEQARPSYHAPPLPMQSLSSAPSTHAPSA